jgi:hypothetical protein
MGIVGTAHTAVDAITDMEPEGGVAGGTTEID